MKTELLELLRCQKTGQRLRLENGNSEAHDIEEGWLVSANDRERYPVIKGIPRFVPQSNYADNFGMQWNHFRQTQLDSHSGHPISTERYCLATGWKPEQLKDQWVLDAGCGAGLFQRGGCLLCQPEASPQLACGSGRHLCAAVCAGNFPVCVFAWRAPAHTGCRQGLCRSSCDGAGGGACAPTST